MNRSLRYKAEAFFLTAFWALCGLFTVDVASALGGWLGRNIAFRLAASRKAARHVRAVFPLKSEAEINAIVRGMWDNLGRVMAEYPHLEMLARERVTVFGLEHLQQHAFSGDKGAVLFSAHAGNWEVAPAYLRVTTEKPVALMYRAPNNAFVDRILTERRTLAGRITALSKSREGGAGAMRAVQSGSLLAILVDQKYNQGVSVPFMGIEAMTNPFFVVLAQKYGVPLIPAWVVRRKGHRVEFEIHVEPPIAVAGREASDVIAEAHGIMERFLTAHPEQWLWLHRRWRGEAVNALCDARNRPNG